MSPLAKSHASLVLCKRMRKASAIVVALESERSQSLSRASYMLHCDLGPIVRPAVSSRAVKACGVCVTRRCLGLGAKKAFGRRGGRRKPGSSMCDFLLQHS